MPGADGAGNGPVNYGEGPKLALHRTTSGETFMPFDAIGGIVPGVAPSSFIHPTASLIGDVVIGPGCYVGPGASLRGDFGRVIMKAGGNFQDGCIAHSFPGMDALMEENAHVGHGAVLHGCTV